MFVIMDNENIRKIDWALMQLEGYTDHLEIKVLRVIMESTIV